MSTTDLPGSSLLAGRYRLVERLGAGGMSVVWRGFDEVLGRQVAVKVLPPSTSADSSFRRRLRAEAKAAARLSHPHITNVYDYGEATTVDGEAVPYVVMELVDGESLAAALARTRRMPWPSAVQITAEVAAALAAAHARGIVHRDVTPSNVMLTSTGAKVVDFGISALIGESDIDPDGSLLGTPAYLAPERLEGGQVSPATDVYAVGLLIYRTLIGELPWDVGTTTALLRAHQYVEPDPLPPVDGLPAAVADVVERCLRKRPDDRPSCAELAEVLAGAVAGGPVARGYADVGEDTTILPSSQRSRSVSPAPASAPASGSASVAASASWAPPTSASASGPSSASASAPAPASGSAPASASASAPAAASGFARPSPSSAASGSTPSATPASAPTPRAPVPAQASAAGEPAMGAQSNGGSAGRDNSDAPPRVDPPRATPRRGHTNSRRVLIVAGAAALLIAASYSWTLTAKDEGGIAPVVAQTQPSPLAANSKCVVSYAVFSESNNRFKASVTVANRDVKAIKNWNLWFIMQGDQKLSASGKAKLEQQERAVTLSARSPLNPQQAVTMNIAGTYAQSNAAPMVFQLGNQNCETYVSAKPGEPSRPVLRLSNGDVRLGPPVAQNPAPGISVGPNGVAVLVPVPTKPGVPGGGTPPTTGGGVVVPPGGGGGDEPSDTPSPTESVVVDEDPPLCVVDPVPGCIRDDDEGEVKPPPTEDEAPTPPENPPTTPAEEEEEYIPPPIPAE